MRSVRCVCHLRPRERVPVRLSQSRLLFDWDIKGLHHERLKGRSFKGTESHPGFWPFVTSLKPRPAWQRRVLTHTRQHTDTIPVVEKIIDPSRKCTHLQRLCQAANHHSPSPPPLLFPLMWIWHRKQLRSLLALVWTFLYVRKKRKKSTDKSRVSC